MVDDMKMQMRRLEHVIGFTGEVDVTCGDSMLKLVNALSSKYKDDVQSSLRLHRLEFFHDLVESSYRKKETAASMHEEVPSKKTAKEKTDEVVAVKAKDVDDWKNLMSLEKINYVMEHPRSEGLVWKRRISKKKSILNFGDKDLIEWRVAQRFRLRGLEEWAQRRIDARRLTAELGYDEEDLEEDDETKELEELFQMFDPSIKKYRSRKADDRRSVKAKKLSPDRPFNFSGESMEDWTESYSDDSEYSGAEDFVEEIDDFPDEAERKIGEFQVTQKASFDEDQNISELLLMHPQAFSQYRSPEFEELDKSTTFQEWLEIYNKIIAKIFTKPVPEDEKEQISSDTRSGAQDLVDAKLDSIAEDEEEPDDLEVKSVKESDTPKEPVSTDEAGKSEEGVTDDGTTEDSENLKPETPTEEKEKISQKDEQEMSEDKDDRVDPLIDPLLLIQEVIEERKGEEIPETSEQNIAQNEEDVKEVSETEEGGQQEADGTKQSFAENQKEIVKTEESTVENQQEDTDKSTSESQQEIDVAEESIEEDEKETKDSEKNSDTKSIDEDKSAEEEEDVEDEDFI